MSWSSAAGGLTKMPVLPDSIFHLRRVTLAWSAPLLALAACARGGGDPAEPAAGAGRAVVVPQPVDTVETQRDREQLVRRHILPAGVKNPAVIAALRKVPRHLFVPRASQAEAYADHPLPIGHGQTISQPSLVALMTELLEVGKDATVLEIGTGSGYQAAILGEIVREVYSIEIVRPLGEAAADRLHGMGYRNVHVRVGDGYQGWPEAAPFDAIIVTCAPERVPQLLIDQLRPGGRICIPVGPTHGTQQLYLMVKRTDGTLEQKAVLPVRFVPMTGQSASQPR